MKVVRKKKPHRGVTPCRGGGAVLVDQYPQGLVGAGALGIQFNWGLNLQAIDHLKGGGRVSKILLGRL